jgi:hypothetical protein
MKYDDGTDGLSSISKLHYSLDDESKNPMDNVYTIESNKIFYINILTFLTKLRHEEDNYYSYDLREPARKIIHPNKLKKTNKTIVTTDDWRNIPYYSKQNETQISIEKDNMEMAEHIANTEREMRSEKMSEDLRQKMQQQIYYLQQGQDIKRLPQTPTNIYSAEYSRQLGIRPQAMPSARIGLGGLR